MAADLRADGRADDQLRPLSIRTDYLRYAEGSVLIEAGHTKVICAATVDEKVPPFLKGKGGGWVTAEYSLLPRSTFERTPREAATGKIGGRTHEIQRLIGRSLRSVVDLTALGERTIWLDCDVVQADGGTRTTALCGAFVAMCLALAKLREKGTLRGWPVVDWLAATSVGIIARPGRTRLVLRRRFEGAGGHERRDDRRRALRRTARHGRTNALLARRPRSAPGACQGWHRADHRAPEGVAGFLRSTAIRAQAACDEGRQRRLNERVRAARACRRFSHHRQALAACARAAGRDRRARRPNVSFASRRFAISELSRTRRRPMWPRSTASLMTCINGSTILHAERAVAQRRLEGARTIAQALKETKA